MFSRARRNSRAQAKQKAEIPQDHLPVSPLAPSFSPSTRSESTALPSPRSPWANSDRPHSTDGIGGQDLSGPPILPPIRISSAQDLTEGSDAGSLHLDFSKPRPRVATDNASVTSRKSGLRTQQSFEHFSRPRSVLSIRNDLALRSASPATSRPPVPEHYRGSVASTITTTYITQDPMFPRSTSVSPLMPKFPQSASSITSTDSFDALSSRRAVSAGAPEHKRKSRRVGRAVTGPTMVLTASQANGSREDVDTDGTFDAPRMEASMFPTFKPQTPTQAAQDTPVMDRNFIDSRDRPYSQAKPPNFARPGYQATYNQAPSPVTSPTTQEITTPPPASSTPTIGISFESTSAAFPAPQLVTTRPKTKGSMSTVAGVQVPTHHTSSLASKDSTPVASKNDRRMTRLLNPVALLSRRKSAIEITSPDEERKTVPALVRQKAASTIDEIPEDFDPRIKGNIVHDFSAPRPPPRRDFSSSAVTSPVVNVESTPDSAEARRSTHTPLFIEHLDRGPLVVQQQGGIAAETRENKDFLARFSQQSAASTFSQESAILPPFARRSQILDPAQAAAWRDDEGSWSSGRDSGGGRSSTGLVENRQSGISSFSAVSPITRSSDSMQNVSASAFEAVLGSPSPISPQLDRKIEFVDNESSKPGTQRPSSALTARLGTNKFTAEAMGEEKPRETVPSPTATTDSWPRIVQKPTSAHGDSPAKRKSSAKRFSFQLGTNDGDEEKALEDKFRDLGIVNKNKSGTVKSVTDDDGDDDDYFDEGAMDDMDEIEMQMQVGATTPTAQVSPVKITIPTQEKLRSTPSSIPTSAVDGRKGSADGFYNFGNIPYVPNERELTYAEHPVFRTHSALADSRRESLQSNFLDSYLATSPSTGSRRDERSRQGSLVDSSGSGRDTSRRGSLQSVRGPALQQVSAMTTLPERTESSTPRPQTPKEPGTIEQRAYVDSALGSLTVADAATAKPGRARADSDTDAKPKWTRTADLWKQYKKEDGHAIDQAQLTTPSPAQQMQSRAPRYTGRRSGSSGQSRLSMASSHLPSIAQQQEDIYFDDGQFEQDTSAAVRSQTDESNIDRLPVPNRGQKDYAQQRVNSLGIIGIASNGTREASTILPQDLSTTHADDEPEQGLEAYHQALADAANRAAAEGRFMRQGSMAEVNAIKAATPSQLAFDFGFGAPEPDDYEQEEDDDIVAAANAEALAYDTDGFYGSEFGFYANARPGAGAEVVSATNGGFFGDDGDDGLTRKRSVKEPNLTPITERSEFSTRNSLINLPALASSAMSTPSLARIAVNAFSDNDITTFEQLKQLRKNAFGGSNGSLGSRSSPTTQQFQTGSVPMAFGYSTGSSSSGERQTSISPSQEHVSHRAALAQDTPSHQTHSRKSSGPDTAVAYVREQENGNPRWVMEKRRTSGLGQIELNRTVVSDGWI